MVRTRQTAAQPTNELEDSQEKCLDPNEDTALMHYWKFGRHLIGSSKKRIKRVEKLSNFYNLENEILWYRKNMEEEFKLQIPLPEQRKDIISKRHLFGHFDSKSVYDALKEYYWNKMSRDIQDYVKKCMPCIKNNKSRVFENPAQAISIENMFERIGIDLVWYFWFGLAETEDRYTGIIVIVEYLSKFPYAVPIISKTAEEIAERLFEYISKFGPSVGSRLQFSNNQSQIFFMKCLIWLDFSNSAKKS